MRKESALDTVLSEFLKISQIPRPSHHEERISAYLYRWAESRGLSVEKDELGEIIIDKPASPGCGAVPRVIFQAHMDMVCVAKAGVAFDPENDAITVINDGVTLRADGTSLGADDGIGVAICLCLLQDDTLRHGPIRAIFTVNEEDGMASVALDKKYLDGEYLVNLDWEETGFLCNSCAGGDFYRFSHPADWESAGAYRAALEIGVSGLHGGHSGMEINQGHANALVSIATALEMLRQGGVDFRIADFSGGHAKNAIPASGSAVVAVRPEDVEKALEILHDFGTTFREAFGGIEKTLKFSCGPTDAQYPRVLGAKTGYGLIGLVTAVPSNVHTMSPFIGGLVESSSNLGIVTVDEKRVQVNILVRSSEAYRATQIGVIDRALAELCGFDFVLEGHVPGWAVRPDSRLTKIACEAYRRITGEAMVFQPVHAGVECGAFAGKNPQLDMISIGPTLKGVHTPNETCYIADVKVVIDLLVAILEKIAE